MESKTKNEELIDNANKRAELNHQELIDKVLGSSKPHSREGKIVGVAYSPDGEKPVYIRNGKEVIEEPEQKPLAVGFNKIAPELHEAIRKLEACVYKVKQLKREVPVLRSELEENGVDRKAIKRLESLGLVKVTTLILNKNNKNVGGRACVYFTPQGNAYVREKLLKEPQSWEDIANL